VQLAIEILLVIIVFAFVLYPLIGAKPVKRPAARSDVDFESEILKRRRRKERFCTKCGAANPADARFCSACATKLTKEN
jgi:ribosomal protein L40E